MGVQHASLGSLSRELRCFAPLGAVPRNDLQYPDDAHSLEDRLVRLGRTIRAARKASGLSQEDLALKADIDYSTMGEIERGQRNATLAKIMRISTALNRSMADLFAGAEI